MTLLMLLAVIFKDVAAGPFLPYRQSKAFLTSVFLKERTLVIVNVEAVLKGNFAESPRLFKSSILHFLFKCENINGIIGFIVAVI